MTTTTIRKFRDLDTNDTAFEVDGKTFSNYGDALAWATSRTVEAFCDGCDELTEVVPVDGLLLCELCR